MSTSDGLPMGSERERDLRAYRDLCIAEGRASDGLDVRGLHSAAEKIAKRLRAALAGSGERETLTWAQLREVAMRRGDGSSPEAVAWSKVYDITTWVLASAPPEAEMVWISHDQDDSVVDDATEVEELERTYGNVDGMTPDGFYSRAQGAAPREASEERVGADITGWVDGQPTVESHPGTKRIGEKGVTLYGPVPPVGPPEASEEPEIYCKRCGSCGSPGCCPTSCDGGPNCLYPDTYAEWYHGLILGPRAHLDEIVPPVEPEGGERL